MKLKGKLTYSALAGVVVVLAGQAFGVEIAESDVAKILEGVLVLTAIFGRWRATRVAK